ncbi:VanZ family protein [Egicoccus halophilus]|uniref:VanZ-like domain-containing protein n=1 Tax=Egicoccus halophilus TaxID=1670830 RepID=A0A8J3AFV1_9ACTN|nr:VanZ family protein [Egicoccus halophilus]GGI07179.1 hypothetical protein GCM10011354_22790 [Egicoccus halophilus]
MTVAQVTLGVFDLAGLVAALVTALALAGAVGAASSWWRRRRDGAPRRVRRLAALDGGLVGSVALLVLATFSPLAALGAPAPAWGPMVNLVPGRELVAGGLDVAVVNVLLLVPLAVVAALRWPWLPVPVLALAALGVSLAVELGQLAHPLRLTNVDDVLLNTFGATVAAGLVRRRPDTRNPPYGAAHERADRDGTDD